MLTSTGLSPVFFLIFEGLQRKDTANVFIYHIFVHPVRCVFHIFVHPVRCVFYVFQRRKYTLFDNFTIVVSGFWKKMSAYMSARHNVFRA